MAEFWIGLAFLGALASWWVLRRTIARAGPGAPTAPLQRVKEPAFAADAASGEGMPTAPSVAAPRRPLPQVLEAFTLRRAVGLAPERLQWTMERLREIPRPPRALHRMTSPDFVAQASSGDLAELVMSEPLVAAKVMATVHSPAYGVQRTAGTIGQAITFIGTTSVRNICLRYLLDESFKTDNAHIKKIFDALGDASTLASEMCLQLSKKIGLPDAPALMTQVLLSYTGHLAATVLQVGLRGGASRSHSVPLLQRFYGQQQELGLPGPEVGLLLMREWGLPAELAEGVAEIDRVLVTPVDGMAPERAAPLALGYLCARLADRITAGQIEDTRSIETLLELDPDFHHLHGYLALPALSGLREALAAPGA